MTASSLKSFASLAGLKLTTNGIAYELEVHHNPALTSLVGLGACCSGPTAGLRIHANPALTSLTGLEQFTSLYELYLIDNDGSKDLTGLGGVTEVSHLVIGSECYLEQFDPEPIGNDGLVSLAGMGKLTSVDSVEIIGNLELSAFSGLTWAPIPA